MKKQFFRLCLLVSCGACLVLIAGLFGSNPTLWQPALAVVAICTPIGLGAVGPLAGFRFTAWILSAVAMGLLYPDAVLHLRPLNDLLFRGTVIDLQNKWLILIIVQLVMFGMGTKMSLQDFKGVAKMPYPVFIGIGLQFLIMPLTGYTLAKLFGLPDEIAAGVVLIGSCSSGLASNVMCYTAGANLALSVTLTSMATLLAPLATPFWMKMLAGEFVQIDAWAMAGNIVKIVLLPIGAAMLHDYLKNSPPKRKRQYVRIALLSAVGLLLLGFYSIQMAGKTHFVLPPSVNEWSFLLGGAVLVALVYHYAAEFFPWVEKQMHVISMAGIIYFTLVTTAAGRDNLLVCGLALVAVAIIHNLTGYTFGYSLSRLAGLDKTSALTVAFEVGMQNGGMASSLAGLMGKLGTLGLAAAVFSPWMNVSGSLLANAVKRRNANESHCPEADRS